LITVLVDTNFLLLRLNLVNLPIINQVFGAVAGDCWIISTRQYRY